VDWNRTELREEHHFIQLEQIIIGKRGDGHRYVINPGIVNYEYMFNLPKTNTCSEELVDDQQTLIGFDPEYEYLSRVQSMDEGDNADEDELPSVIPTSSISSMDLASEHLKTELPETFLYKDHRIGHEFKVEYKILVMMGLGKGIKPFLQSYPLLIRHGHQAGFTSQTMKLSTPLLNFGHGIIHRNSSIPFHIVSIVPRIIHEEFMARVLVVFPKEMGRPEGVMIKDLTVKLKSTITMRAQGMYSQQIQKIVLFEKSIPLDMDRLHRITESHKGVLGSLCGEYLEIDLKLRVPDQKSFKICNGVLRHKVSFKGRVGFGKMLKTGFKLEGDVKLI
jgi:hypothetical protein